MVQFCTFGQDMLFGPLGGDNLPIEKKRLPTLVWSFYALNSGQDMPEVTYYYQISQPLAQSSQNQEPVQR